MLEEQLENIVFLLIPGGLFSVKSKVVVPLKSINYTIELLSDRKNLVLLFPQGKIASIYDQFYPF